MMISPATAHAFAEISEREADVLHAYTPGAIPAKNDVASTPSSAYTRDALSAAAPADAYFVSCDTRGELCFGRDGGFALRDGALVDVHGRPVMGYAAQTNSLAPLHADPVDAALGYTTDARIERDGSVTYGRAAIDPRTGRREESRISIGRVALARFAAGTKLTALDASSFTAPPGIAPHLGWPNDGNFSAVEPHARTGSGVDIDAGLRRLQEAYLAFDALRAADHAKGSVAKTAMDLLK